MKIKTIKPKTERGAYVNDLHFPHHDPVAVELAMEFIVDFNPHRLFFNGDIADFYPLSRFDKDPSRISSLQAELDMAVDYLARFRRRLPGTEIHLLEGNHEYRLTKWLRANPGIHGLKCLEMSELFRLRELKILHTPYMKHVDYNGFIVEHGDMARKHSGYTARGMLDKRGVCGLSGHTHRMGACYQTDLSGIKVWYENGCLCDLNPEYVNGKPNWQQGFSISHFIKGDDRFIVEQIPIIDGVLFRGEKTWAAA